MRLENDAVLGFLRRDPERWLYRILDLSDPVRSSGISCYAADADRPAEDLVILARFAEGTTVWLHSDRPDLLAEAASDPGVGPGTRFCFCRGLPAFLRDRREAAVSGHRLLREDGRRTLERYGLFGTREAGGQVPCPAGFRIAAADEADRELLAVLDPALWGTFPAASGQFGPGDRLWLAHKDGGALAGYLWATEAGRAFWDIVNVFTAPEFRGRGLGRALLDRYVREARIRGRLAYYGYAVSRESAALARSLGFREIFGETVSFFAES